MSKWLDWFGVRYVDFCGAHKSWPARILIGVVDAILLVGFWSYGMAASDDSALEVWMMLSNSAKRKLLIAGFLATATPAFAGATVFECSFSNISHLVITIYDDGSPAHIGEEQGVGDFGTAVFDPVTGAWVVVEGIERGKVPIALTTILSNGKAWHSRQPVDRPPVTGP